MELNMKPNDITNKFSIDIDQINQRFAALEARTQDSESRLAKSERKLRVMWSVSTLAALVTLTIGWHKDAIAQGYGITLAQAATRIAALETKTQDISRLTDPNTNRTTVRFTGVNVQIVNGSGRTEATTSGVGNLIVGYNEMRGDGSDNRTGSHNLVLGVANNYSSTGGAVFGYKNTISGDLACVVGGLQNTANGFISSISGGDSNTTSAQASSVSGGFSNTASSDDSSISGGQYNFAIGAASSVSGGQNNTAGSGTGGVASSVSGGDGNTASGQASSVSGGYINTASGDASSISGGNQNATSGAIASVSGGNGNRASGGTSSVSGGRSNTASGINSSVSGGNTRTAPSTNNWAAGTQAVQ